MQIRNGSAALPHIRSPPTANISSSAKLLERLVDSLVRRAQAALRARRNRALNLVAHGHGQLRLSLEMRLQQPRGALLVAVERRFHDRFVLAVGGDRALGIFPEVAAIALHVVVELVE